MDDQKVLDVIHCAYRYRYRFVSFSKIFHPLLIFLDQKIY